MAETDQRFTSLKPLSISTEARVAIEATSFFSPMNIAERTAQSGALPGSITPAQSTDFLKHLESVRILVESQRYIHQVRDLLFRLDRDGILISFPSSSGNPMLPKNYYCLYEISKLRQDGLLWLSKSLGSAFIYDQVSPAIVHIVGRKNDGDDGEGSGIVFDSHHVLTCKHVVEEMQVAADQVFQGIGVTVEKVFTHPKDDVAVIRVHEPLSPALGLGFLKPEVTQRVYRFGCSRLPCEIPSPQVDPVVESGEVTRASVTVFTKEELFLYSAITRPGDSGGAIVSDDGYVVGIATQLTDARYKGNDSVDVFSPYYTGIPAHTLAKAVEELEAGAQLPYETFE